MNLSGIRKYSIFFLAIFIFGVIFFLLRNPIRSEISNLFAKKPGTCLVLEQQYCGTGDTVLGFLAGFKLPAGTPLFAPFDGYVASSSVKYSKSGDGYRQMVVYVSPDGDYLHKTLLVAMSPVELTVSSGPVKKGQLVGRTTGAIVAEAGDYNFVAVASKQFGSPDTGFVENFFKMLLK